VDDHERAAEIDRLLQKLSEAADQRAALLIEAKALNIGKVRDTLGNPFFYSGEHWERPENADESIANFSGYTSHEPALRLIREIRRADREMNTIREQLKHLGYTTE